MWGFPPCFKHDSQVSEVSPGGSEGNSLLSGLSHLCCRLSPHNLCFTFSCHRELHLQLPGRRASQRHLPTPQTSLRLQCLLSPRHGVSCSSWAVIKSGDLFLVMNFCKRYELRVCAAPPHLLNSHVEILSRSMMALGGEALWVVMSQGAALINEIVSS